MAESLSMYDRVLALRPDLRPVPLPPDRVMLVGERARHLLQGVGYPPLLAALDGRRTVRAVIAAAGVDGATALFLIGRLEAGGWLVDAARGPRTAFGQALGVEPGAAVAVESLDGAGAQAEALADALRGFGLAIDPGAARAVVPVGDPLDPGLDALARRLRAEGRRWLPVVASGVRWWFGPAFAGEVAQGGPCWQCLAARLRLNHPVRAWLARAGLPHTVRRDAPPAASRAAFGLAAPAIARWAAGADHPLDGTLIEVDPIGLTLERHGVVRRPQCPACGDPDLIRARAERPIALRARPITTDDGGYRAVAPAETWARLAHHVSPVTGVVARLWPIDARSHVGPVFGAVSPVCPADERPPAGGFRQLSMGKGRTVEQARVSALCEALERHVWRWQGDEPHRRATTGELGGSAVLPGAVQLFSAAQMAAADALPADDLAPTRPRDAARVPRPHPADAPLDWTPAWSLTHGCVRYLPTAWCHAGAPRADDRRYVVTDSNGLAAGNGLEEAILQGFLELVERDAVGIWWYNRLRRPALDPAAFGDDWLMGCVARLDGIGWDLWVLDLTHDLGIPVCAALARERGGERRSARWSVGFGCHLEARLALGRALTELGQQFDPSSGHRAPWPGLPSTDFLKPAPGPPRGPDAFESFEVRDLRAAVELCVARAAGAGLETLVLDLTRPDIELAVARVCVPGLRHFWPRFAPGRLYTVPVAMGWRAAPLAEGALNPVPLWL